MRVIVSINNMVMLRIRKVIYKNSKRNGGGPFQRGRALIFICFVSSATTDANTSRSEPLSSVVVPPPSKPQQTTTARHPMLRYRNNAPTQ